MHCGLPLVWALETSCSSLAWITFPAISLPPVCFLHGWFPLIPSHLIEIISLLKDHLCMSARDALGWKWKGTVLIQWLNPTCAWNPEAKSAVLAPGIHSVVRNSATTYISARPSPLASTFTSRIWTSPTSHLCHRQDDIARVEGSQKLSSSDVEVLPYSSRQGAVSHARELGKSWLTSQPLW